MLQIKTNETDGYSAVQLGFGVKNVGRTTRAEKGHAAKAGVEAVPRVLREFPVSEDDHLELGQAITVDIFKAGDSVKVTGTSKGRGFQVCGEALGLCGSACLAWASNVTDPGLVGPWNGSVSGHQGQEDAGPHG